MARATIEVTADVARYQAELAKIPGMTDKSAAKAALKLQERLERAEQQAAKAAERAATKAAEAASGVAKFGKTAELLERMRAALGPLGDSLSDLTGGADDLATALDGFSAKQVAMAAGAVAVVAGLAKLSGAVLDVIGNLEAYEDQIAQLQKTGDLTSAQVQGLREASAAVATLKESFGGLVIVLAAEVAPVIEDLSRGIVAVAGFMSGGFEGMREAAGRFNTRLQETVEKSERLREEDAAAKAAKSSKQAAAEARAAWKAYTDQFGSFTDELQKFTTANEQMDNLLTEAVLRPSNALDEINLKYDTLANQVIDLALETGRYADAQVILADIEQRRLKELDETQAKLDEKQRKRREKQLKEARDASAKFAAHQLEVQSAMLESASAIASNVMATLDSVMTMFDTSTTQGKKAARSIAAAQRALAIFQIGINLAQAIGQSLAQGGPVAGAALAAAVSSAFAGLIATVSRPIPQFHTGRFGASSGMLTDERMTGGVMTVAPEVVIPPDLVSRSGGADGVRSRLEDDRPMIVQAVIDLTDERIVLPLSRALGARERGRIGIPLGRT